MVVTGLDQVIIVVIGDRLATMWDTGMVMAGVIIMVIIVVIQQGQQPVITTVRVQKLLIHHPPIPGQPIEVQMFTGIVKQG